ncbi:RidA family protein [Microbacterium sp. LMC-P-041]|uniref:RidA family protein n=1 Tax=Microbacterium sp. LMC-P-041 TaxID=3040293 RepID=UPI0025578480|nr:RidA family protein [Microbacterium sp. LMC-P-041]
MIERMHPQLDQYVATTEFAFHLAVKTDGIVFTQGVGPLSREFEVIGGDDLSAQCEFTLKTLADILETAGSSPRHMLNWTIYLTDPQGTGEIGSKYLQILPQLVAFVGEEAPTATAAGVSALFIPGQQIEISAIAKVIDA